MPDKQTQTEPQTETEDETGWVPLTDLSMFEGNKGETLDNTNWDALDFSSARDFQWYKNKFPGFPDDILEILVKCDGTYRDPDENQNQWERKQALNDEIAKRQKHIINFD